MDPRIFGWELMVRFSPSSRLSLEASWTHREVSKRVAGSFHAIDDTPKNLLSLGGRFRTDLGLLGSLYLFSRSEFWDHAIKGQDNILAPFSSVHMDNCMLVMGKLAWRWLTGEGIELETGLDLFLPISPFSGQFFRTYEKAGNTTANGGNYGGELLNRMITVYLQGAF
jgi:hypothetical protein